MVLAGHDLRFAVGMEDPELHEGVMPLARLSLEQVHSLCFNRGVTLNESSTAALPPLNPAKVIAFSDLRLAHSMTAKVRILFEYEDGRGERSFHDVSLTCSGEGASGNIYLGGYDTGKFRVFRADRIHRVMVL